MPRFIIAFALLAGIATIAGCGGSLKYPYAEDFNAGIPKLWKVDENGVKIEVVDGELNFSGQLGGLGKTYRRGVMTDNVFPESDFSASVDFRVPVFEGNGTPLVYLIAHSEGGNIGVFYHARHPAGYQLHDLNSAKMSELFPAIGDEKTKNHRLRLNYEYRDKKAAAYIDDQLIASTNGINLSGPVGFELCIVSDQPAMGAKVIFDNFSVVAPPSAVPASAAENTPPQPLAMTKPGMRSSPTQPEAAVLKLQLAVAKKDADAIRELIIPHPEWKLLCLGEKALAEVVLDLESRIKNGPSNLREMAPGDRLYHRGKLVLIADSDLMPGLVIFETTDFPKNIFFVRRMNRTWKVDISFLLDRKKDELIEKSKEVKLEDPERALVDFSLAVLKGNKAAIEKSIVPNPEWAILAEGQHAPESAYEFLEAQLRLPPFQRLKPGDSFPICKGKTHVVENFEITADRLLINLQGAPLPFILVRTDGVWKVDAGPIIADRKAAAAAAKKP